MTTNEGDLLSGLEDTGHPDASASAPGWFVLTSNFTLPIMLARGVLLAPGAGESSEVTMLDAWGCELPKNDHGVPVNWAREVEAAGRSVFPIALRLGEGRDVGRLTIGGTSVEYLLLSSVREIVFRSETEKERFLSWGFENVPDVGLSDVCTVSGDVFEKDERPLPASPGSSAGFGEISGDRGSAMQDQVESRHRLLARADSIAGLAAVVVRGAARVPGWIRALESLGESGPSRQCGDGGTVWEIASSLRGVDLPPAGDLDSALLRAAARVVVRYPRGVGWPVSKVLEEIGEDEEVRKLIAVDPGAGEQLKLWMEKCAGLIAARGSPPNLSDSGSVVRRGVLLLLLRGGDVREITQTAVGDRRSELIIGRRVRMIALALAGLRTGLRALPTDFKGRSCNSGMADWREPLSRLLLGELVRGGGDSGDAPDARIGVAYRRRGTLEGDWIVAIGDACPIEVRAEFDDRLKEVAARLKRLGFDVSDGDDERLTLAVGKAEGAKVSVVVEVLSRSDDDAGVVRCVSEVGLAEEPKPGGRRARRRRISTMPKEFFVGLLKEQMRSHLCGRYALTEDGETLLVVSEQALATLDDAEFKAQVVDIANQTRRSLGL